MSSEPLAVLNRLQNALLALVEPLEEALYREQAHPQLSALGWHLGHCAFVERLWVRGELLGLEEPQADLQELYLPEHSAKTTRGERLPPAAKLCTWANKSFAETQELLRTPSSLRRPELLQADFLPNFLLQHHAQHLETMRLALIQWRLRRPCTGTRSERLGRKAWRRSEWRRLPAGRYRIGTDSRKVFDNERPPRVAELAACRLASRVVSNGDYLEFMRDGGYCSPRWWCREGWRWRERAQCTHPDNWRHHGDDWYSYGPHGAQPLSANGPLAGVNLYEARAYATWAGARLPHEYEWEAAARLGLLDDIGLAWEWCDNRFHPYPGFRAYPYARYSTPWFDGRHYVLRGSSVHSSGAIRRPSFRNFYTAEQRHICAGIRLAK